LGVRFGVFWREYGDTEYLPRANFSIAFLAIGTHTPSVWRLRRLPPTGHESRYTNDNGKKRFAFSLTVLQKASS